MTVDTSGVVSADGFDFSVSCRIGKAHLVFAPQNPPVRNPSGTQQQQSQGRLTYQLPNGYVAIYDIVPATDPLPGFAPQLVVESFSIGEDSVLTGRLVALDKDSNAYQDWDFSTFASIDDLKALGWVITGDWAIVDDGGVNVLFGTTGVARAPREVEGNGINRARCIFEAKTNDFTAQSTILRMTDTPNSNFADLRIGPDERLRPRRFDTSSNLFTSAGAISQVGYTEVEIDYTIGIDGVGRIKVLMDGALDTDFSGDTQASVPSGIDAFEFFGSPPGIYVRRARFDFVGINSCSLVGAVTGLDLQANGDFIYTPPTSLQSLNDGQTLIVPVTVVFSDPDGHASLNSSFNITITGSADAPVVDALPVITTNALAPVQFNLTATDVEDDIDPDSWLLSTPPLKGVATISPDGEDCEYNPNGDFAGLGVNDVEDVTFGVTVDDLQAGTSVERIITVRVTGADVAPTASNGSIFYSEDTTTTQVFDLSTLVSAHPSGAPIASYQMLTQPADHTVVFDGVTGAGTLLPSPTAFQSLRQGQSASRAFTFVGIDENGNSSPVRTFNITILGADDIPVAVGGATTVNAGAEVFFTPTYTDVDSAGLYASGPAWEITAPAYNLATLETVGVGTFEWLNDTHQAVGLLAPGRCKFITGSDFDALEFGTSVTIRQPFRVRDAEGNWSAEKYMDFTVAGQAANDDTPPVMQEIFLVTTAGVPVSFELINRTSDVDGDFAIWELLGFPTDINGDVKGAAVLSASVLDPTYETGLVTYSPGGAFSTLPAGSSAEVTFPIHHIDGNGNPSNEVLVHVTINGVAVQHPPDAPNIIVDVDYQGTANFQITATDQDNDLDADSYLSVTTPTGTIQTISPTGAGFFDTNGQFDGLAPGGSTQVSGSYSVADDGGRVSTGTILYNITRQAASGSPPVISNRNRTADYNDTFIEGALFNHTTDAQGNDTIDWSTIQLETNVTAGILIPPDTTNGYWRFNLNGEFTGLGPGATQSVYFEATVADDQGLRSSIGRVTILIQNTNQQTANAPVVTGPTTIVTDKNTPVNFQLTATDADGNLNASGYAFVSGPNSIADGFVTLNPDGSGTFDPSGAYSNLYANQSATRTLVVTASDTTSPTPLVSTQFSIPITINGVGTAPSEPTLSDEYVNAMNQKWPWETSAMARFMGLVMLATTGAVTAVQDGAWTDPATWGGTVPTGGNVLIPYGTSVVNNQALASQYSGNTAYDMVLVRGNLSFASFMNVRLRCETLLGTYGAHLEMVQGFANVRHEVTIPSLGDINVSNDPALMSRGVIWHGTVYIQQYGAGSSLEQDPYRYLDNSALPAAGATTITLDQDPVDWIVGDPIKIGSFECPKRGSTQTVFHNERKTIAAISGRVITLDSPLAFTRQNRPTHTSPVVNYGDGIGTGGGDQFVAAVSNLRRGAAFISEGGSGIPIHRRPHCMLMGRPEGSDVHIEGLQITGFGRTNKLVPAKTGGQMGTNPIVADTNLKGRYSLHCHFLGYNPVDEIKTSPPTIRNVVVDGVVGWGIVAHRGWSRVEDSVVTDVVGGGIIEESGDTYYEWGGNVVYDCHARRTGPGGLTGSVQITKGGAFTNFHDFFATGQGLGMAGRMGHLYATARGWNRVYGWEGEAFAWLHREKSAGFATSTQDFGLHKINSKNMDLVGALFGEVDEHPEKPAMQVTAIMGCGGRLGAHVIKQQPGMEHDDRIFFRNMMFCGVSAGMEVQYTAHYSNQNGVMVHSALYNAPISGADGFGFKIYNNTLDMVFADLIIDGFGYGGHTTHFRTNETAAGNAGCWGYIYDNLTFLNCDQDFSDLQLFRTGQDGITGPEDLVFNMTTAGVPNAISPPNPRGHYSETWDLYPQGSSNPTSQWSFGSPATDLRFVIHDHYGLRNAPAIYGPNNSFFPNGRTDMYRFHRTEAASWLAYDGYWKTPGGSPYIEVPWPTTPRDQRVSKAAKKRIYLASDVPGVNGVAPNNSFGGGATFTLNGVAA